MSVQHPSKHISISARRIDIGEGNSVVFSDPSSLRYITFKVLKNPLRQNLIALQV